ncbi:vacuolar protein sorting-associated protein 35B [Helianthus annuus]|nr:vacuolar protein sorting-associated protein 35B [Helianthus annuus]XP_021974168.1 vacuolar protein sorting-associated protein 35B [Helianthus annuus]XP_021974169.1 vacuolar protein sorting-associated protein 35B [Helianthus annuus]
MLFLPKRVIETQGDMPVVGAITLYVSLLTFTLHFHPDRLDYVDQVLLGPCLKILSNKPKLEDSRATKQVVALLSAPLEKYSDIFTSLTLSNYSRVMDHLDSGTNKIMAMVIIQSIMTNQACVSSVDKVDALFELTKGLIKDLEGDSDDEFFTTFSVATKSRFRLRVFLIKGSRIWLLTWTR